MIGKELLLGILGTCFASGAFFASATPEWCYDSALKDPALYHLIDQSGNPVSQEADESE